MQLSTSSRNGGIFFFLFSLLSSLLLLSSQSCTALAAPTRDFESLAVRVDKNIPTEEELKLLIEPEHLSDFSKFAKHGQPHKDKAIFFTGQDAKNVNKIVKWAHKEGLTSVRNIWKSGNFFQRGQYKEVSDGDFKKFQQAFSKFYALHTSGKAYLVFPHDKTPSKSGIFWSIELEEIIQHGKVDEIVWIDQNQIDDEKYKFKDEKKIYWKKGSPKPSGA